MYFDPASRSLTLRILYDGSGTAGKTTNLLQIAEQFSASRVGVMVSPETPPGGRTRYFDWVELKAGKIEGFPLRCQLLSVPGQFVYAERRMELLKRADAIVCVCDSAEDAIRRVLVGIRFLQAALVRFARSETPIIVQANKQDLPNALPTREIAAMLGLPEKSVHGANAASGTGVRTTLLAAIHAAVAQLRGVLHDHGVDAISQEVETPESLYEHLRDLPEEELHAAQDLVDHALGESSSSDTAESAKWGVAAPVPDAPVTKPNLDSERPTTPPPPPLPSSAPPAQQVLDDYLRASKPPHRRNSNPPAKRADSRPPPKRTSSTALLASADTRPT
ncbi:MAG: hypothetical protein HOO96_43530, partial [Polyangiaceae bacterium]|nr:hypothetical protein [Polyangiaceae bacterium]